MIKNLKAIAAAFVCIAMLNGQTPAARSKGRNKAMGHEGQLVWGAAIDDFGHRQRVYFTYSPGHGLSDVDFHPITAGSWKQMKSPSGDAVSYLQVVKETTVSQLEEVIGHIAEQGGYKTIVVSVGQ